MRRRAALPTLMGMALLAAGCTPGVPASGPASDDDGGIGGTGARRADRLPDEGGIGGTGVFGTVTDLGSLEVNGVRIETPGAATLETLFGQRSAIAPGDTVAVLAAPAEGRLVARRVAVFHPLIGPLQAAGEGQFAVLGTRVLLAADVPVRGPGGERLPQARLRPGQVVAVSGIWQDRAVVATGVLLLGAGTTPAGSTPAGSTPAGSTGPAVVRGLLRRRDGGLVVGETRLDFGGRPTPGFEERFATLRGTPDGRGLTVREVDVEPLAVFSSRVGALSVEGYLAPNLDSPGFHLSGFGLLLDTSSPVVARTGERRLFLGRYRDRFRVEASLPLPPTADLRRGYLEGDAASPAVRRWLAGP